MSQQETSSQRWLMATLRDMQAEIDRLKARVAELEGHPAVSVPPLRVVYDPFRPATTAGEPL
jgi:hypothetical protein